MKIVKYIGKFGAVSTGEYTLKAGVPTPLPDTVADELLLGSDYQESSEAELAASVDEYGSVHPVESKPTKPESRNSEEGEPVDAAVEGDK